MISAQVWRKKLVYLNTNSMPKEQQSDSHSHILRLRLSEAALMRSATYQSITEVASITSTYQPLQRTKNSKLNATTKSSIFVRRLRSKA